MNWSRSLTGRERGRTCRPLPVIRYDAGLKAVIVEQRAIRVGTFFSHSLLDRFSGTFLGAAIASAFASSSTSAPLPRGLGSQQTLLPADLYPDLLLQEWQTSSQYLIHRNLIHRTIPAEPLERSPIVTLAATLPLGLYKHDQPRQLDPEIQSYLTHRDHLELEPLAVVINGAIGQILQNRHPLQDLYPRLEPYSATLPEHLFQMEQLITQETTLAEMVEKFTPTDAENSLVLGFYCFLTTPTDFRLTLLRAGQTKSALAIFTAGVLAGVNNGWTGIPWHWSPPLMQPFQELATHLLARWAGVDAGMEPSELPVSLPLPR